MPTINGSRISAEKQHGKWCSTKFGTSSNFGIPYNKPTSASISQTSPTFHIFKKATRLFFCWTKNTITNHLNQNTTTNLTKFPNINFPKISTFQNRENFQNLVGVLLKTRGFRNDLSHPNFPGPESIHLISSNRFFRIQGAQMMGSRLDGWLGGVDLWWMAFFVRPQVIYVVFWNKGAKGVNGWVLFTPKKNVVDGCDMAKLGSIFKKVREYMSHMR